MSECINCRTSLTSSTLTQPENMTCPATGFQKIDVCVPVSVTPFANAGKTRTICCGDPVVDPKDKPCPGKKNGVCTFTISQRICVEVPVDFGATAMVGDVFVDCKEASSHNICSDCDDDDEDM